MVALPFYVACELAIWRPGVAFGITVGVVGSTPSSDYQVGTWSLEWWPWAIMHGVNPLHTGLLWAPSGYSTTWITSVPALALLAAPVTLLAGPLVAYNLLMLAAPPGAAVACYLLCRELCERFWPALLGGFLFGFSPYVLAQTVSQHLNLVMVWPLPLLVLIAVRYCRGLMSSRRAIATSSALLLFLFGTSLELFATGIGIGGIVLAVAVVFGRSVRVRLLELALVLGAFARRDGTVMFQHVVPTKLRLEELAIHARCLLDDAGKRDDNNHPTEPLMIRNPRLGVMMRDVLERKGQRTERLAAASRRREREQAGRLSRSGQTIIEKLATALVHAAVTGEAGQMTTKDFQGADGLKLRNLSKTCGSWIEVILRVAEVGIHEAGEEQAGAQSFREMITRSSGRNVRQAEAIRR